MWRILGVMVLGLGLAACGEDTVIIDCTCTASCNNVSTTVDAQVCDTAEAMDDGVQEAVDSCVADLQGAGCNQASCSCECEATDETCTKE